MSENINCYKHLIPKSEIDKPSPVVNDGDEKPRRNDKQEDTKDSDNRYQKTSDWMRGGGKHSSIKL